MSPLEKHLLRRSFGQLAAHSEQTTALFLDRLQTKNPALLECLTNGNGSDQRWLMEDLAVLIRFADEVDELGVYLETMRSRWTQIRDGQRRQAEHAFLWAIEQRLADDYTSKTRAAWLHFFRLLVRLSQ